MRRFRLIVLPVLASVSLSASAAQQAVIYKTASGTLNGAADWSTVSGVAGNTNAGAGRVGVFDANSATSVSLGGSVTLDALSVSSVTGGLSIAAGGTLTLGSVAPGFVSGIDLSGAANDANVACGLAFSQSALVYVNAGRMLTLPATVPALAAGTVLTFGAPDVTATVTNLVLGGDAAGALVKITNGTVVVANGRNQSANLELDGGALNCPASANRFGMNGTAGGQALTIHGGSLNVATGGSGTFYGVRLGGDNGYNFSGNPNFVFTGLQDGGTFTVGTAAMSGKGFELGSTSAETNAYTLAGGTLNVQQAGAQGLYLGSDTNGIGVTAFNLVGAGKLVVAGVITGGQSAGAPQQIFNFSGGTLVANSVTTAWLSSTNAPAVYGALVNNGGALAPGDVGTPGKTSITGNYAVSNNAATLAVDLGGVTPANAFQGGPTNFDFVSVSGAAYLGGGLNVNFINGFVPAATNGFTILTAAGVSGSFTNLTANFVPVANYAGGFFQVVTTATSVILTNFGAPSLAPVLNAGSAPFYFTTLSTGLTETATVTIYNSGLQTLTGSVAVAGSPFALVGGTNFVLAGGASANVAVSFSPSTNSTFSGALIFTSNGGNVTNQIIGSGFTPVPSGTAFVQPGQTVVDAGASCTFTAPNFATNYAWRMEGTLVSTNGVVGTNAPTFTYAPSWYDVGTHYLVCYQTLPNGALTNNYWQVRVRIPLPASAASFFVATNGSDNNPGTMSLPFQTLEAARNAVRNLQPLPAGGVTVWLRGGTYFRTNTFLLASNDSGTMSAPVTYRGYPGETAVISAGKPIPASAWSPLNSSQTNRLAPGVNPTNVLELDAAAQGIAHVTPFPAHFNQWTTVNVYNSGFDGGLGELFYNGQRMWLSRYPKHDLNNDNLNTTSLLMDGVATSGTGGTAGTNYLNLPGTYTNSAGAPVAVGCAFHYYPSNATEVVRWQSAFTNGGLWVAGAWRVPWQIDSLQVEGIDPTNRVIEITNTVTVQNGIGDKYHRPAGSFTEPWWVMNLLEELTQPGEWAVDFNRGKIYFLPPGPVADGSVVISDLAAPIVQLTQTTNVVFQSLTFEDGLAQGIFVTNGVNNLVVACTFRNMNNYPVDLNGGYTNGVVSCLLRDLGGGGVLLHGGNASSSPRVPAGHFVVNNVITNCAVIGRVYATPVDVGGNGEGSQSTNCVGMRVAHNLLTVAPETGILHGYTWDSSIEFNDQGNYGQTYGGIGGIYGYTYFISSGNNNFRYNFLHDSPLVDGITFDQDHHLAHVYCNVVNLNPPAIVSLHQCYGTETGSQATPGEEQYLDHYNNLGVNANHGFDVVAPTNSLIEENAMINCLQPYSWQQVVLGVYSNTFSPASPTTSSTSPTALQLQSGPNMAYTNDPGFLNLTNEDMRLNPLSRVYTDMPKFQPIPFEMIGLYNDEYRTNAVGYGPYVLTTNASAVTATGAVLNGRLYFPQFDSNTTVTVYYGPVDGGVNAGAWQFSANLGVCAAGALSAAVGGLQAGTNYYFRFYAANPFGSAWSPAGAAFGTQSAAPTGLTATLIGRMVSLSWNAVANASGYNLKRAASPAGPFTVIAGALAATNYLDNLFPAGGNYYYAVSAVVGGVESADSAPVAIGVPANYFAAWSNRCAISFGNYSAAETLADFPALVVLGTNLTGFAYGQFASGQGRDLRFSDAAQNELAYEIESWNPGSNSYVWVRIPSLTSTSLIYAWWGNPAATNLPAYATNGAAWNANYLAVWHLNQTPRTNVLDSTANNNAATNSPVFPAANQAAGAVGGSLYFNTNWLNVPDSAPLRLTNSGQFTLSAWVNLNAASNGVIIGKGQNGSRYYSWFLTVGNNPGVDNNNATSRLCAGFRTSNAAGDTQVSQTSNVTLSNWVYVAGTLDGNALTLYVNGQSNNAVATAAAPYGVANQLWIGADSGRDYLNGKLDELRVENAARSANWIQASYLTVASNAAFAGYAPVTALAGSLTPAITAFSVTNGQPSFRIGGAAGFAYVVQASTNLTDWVNLSTNAPGAPLPAAWADPNPATLNRRFYRAVLAP